MNKNELTILTVDGKKWEYKVGEPGYQGWSLNDNSITVYFKNYTIVYVLKNVVRYTYK